MSDPFTAHLAEVATDVLPGQVQLLRDLIACRAVSTQLPDEAFVSGRSGLSISSSARWRRSNS